MESQDMALAKVFSFVVFIVLEFVVVVAGFVFLLVLLLVFVCFGVCVCFVMFFEEER